jgi:hypothetical protein
LSHTSSMSYRVQKVSVPPTGVLRASIRSVSRCPPPTPMAETGQGGALQPVRSLARRVRAVSFGS